MLVVLRLRGFTGMDQAGGNTGLSCKMIGLNTPVANLGNNLETYYCRIH